jgi:hypothetical protein
MINMTSIREIADKIKGVGDLSRIWALGIIILATTASFGLGRLSVLEDSSDGVVYFPAVRNQAVANVSDTINVDNRVTEVVPAVDSGSYVASKNGTRYYFPWCGGSKQIKEENKVWFDTKEEAEKAGYSPAQNCKGL